MRKTALSLMITALGILVLGGLIFNNLSASGLVNNNGSMVCDNSTDTCTLSAVVGCQANPNNCNLAVSQIQFLNSCSPFTNILTLNYIGFVSSFSSNCGKFVSPGLTGNSTSINAGQSLGNQSFTGCSNTVAGALGLGQISFKCSTAAPALLNTTPPYHFACGQFQVTIGNQTTTPAIKPSLTQCNFSDSGAATLTVASISCYMYGNVGGSSPSINQVICNSQTLISYGISVSTGAPTSSSLLSSSLVSFTSFIIGAIVLILLGLGINVGALSFNAGTNPQGTKMAQVFGVGLLIWSPLYSEFSTWFTSGYLPFGLDGTIGVVSIGLIACFFFGAYELSQTGTPSS